MVLFGGRDGISQLEANASGNIKLTEGVSKTMGSQVVQGTLKVEIKESASEEICVSPKAEHSAVFT